MAWRYVFEEPPVGTEEKRCAHCEQVAMLARHHVTALPIDEPGQNAPTAVGDVLICPACGKISRPAGRFMRGLALLLMVPISVVLLYGMARGVWYLYDAGAGNVRPYVMRILGSILLVLVGGFLSYRSVRIVTRALSPGWLLPTRDFRTPTEKK